MKILTICHNPLFETKDSKLRGGERSTKGIIEYLSKNGFIVHAVQFGNYKNKEEIRNGVKYFTYNISSKIKKINKCRELCISNDYDLVFTWGEEVKIANILKKEFSLKTVFFVRRLQTLIFGDTKLVKLFEKTLNSPQNNPFSQIPLWKKLLKSLSICFFDNIVYKTSLHESFSDADLVFSNSIYTKKCCKVVFNKDSVVSYPYIKLEDYLVDTSKKYITTIGKGINSGQIIIEKLAKKMTDNKFMSIGHKNKKVNLDNLKLYSDYFSDSKEIYKDTKILLCIRKEPEPFGRVPLEAAISGIPIIANDLGAHKESVGDGGIILSENPELLEIETAIQKIHNNYEYYSQKALMHATNYNGEEQLKIVFSSIKALF